MSITSSAVDTTFKDQRFEGRLVHDDNIVVAKPGVLVCHAFGGRSAFDDDFADELARQGYAALAVDLYGVGIRGSTREESRALMAPFKADRMMLRDHLLHWHTLLTARTEVDESRTGIVGFCFGGLCALDLARSGAPIRAAVSFHGLLDAPENEAPPKSVVLSDILVLHGWDDPMASPDTVLTFAAEMKQRGARWELQAYGNTLHSFTNPNANSRENGTMYSASADQRSRAAMRRFLHEAFTLEQSN